MGSEKEAAMNATPRSSASPVDHLVQGKRITLYGWPHEKKNTFIFSGYVYHETPWETLEHYVSLTNETANIATAFVELALGIWYVLAQLLCIANVALLIAAVTHRLCISTLSYWETLEETPRIQLLLASICYMVATVRCNTPAFMSTLYQACSQCMIVFYHTCNTYAPLYHISSATDLLAINLSILAMALCLAAAGVPNRLLELVVEEELVLLATLGTILAAAGGVFAYRININVEAPKWTIFVNGSPAVTVAAAYVEWVYGMDFWSWLTPGEVDASARAWGTSPLGDDHHGKLFLWFILGGITLYLLKFPERFFPLTFDKLGNSHSIWHVGYAVGLFALSYDCLHAAVIHGHRMTAAK